MLMNLLARRSRVAAMWLLAAVMIVAAVTLVFDGGRPAVAAGDCQYDPYQPSGDPCPPAELTLTTTPVPTEALAGWWLSDIAALSGGTSPTGTLTFALHAPDDEACTTPVYTTQVTVSGARDYYSWEGISSGSAEATAVGVWRWTVSYSGDAQNGPLSSGCGDETVTVSKAGMYLYLYSPSGQQQTIPNGLTVYGNAGGYRPTGAVTVRLFAPDDPSCTGTPVLEQAFPFDGAWSVGIYASIASTDALGVWKWQADYPGDALNEAAALPCGQTYVDVGKAQPSLTASASPPSTEVGSAVSVDGSLTAGHQLAGDVTVHLFGPGDDSCTSPLETRQVAVAADGSFGTTFTLTAVGSWRMTAEYQGDDYNYPASAVCGHAVAQATKATPSLVAAASPTTAEPGTTLQAFTLVNGGYGPTGRVAFRLYGPSDPSCVGLPAYIEEAEVAGSSASTATGFAVPSEGTWRWTATYLGDANNALSTSPCDDAPVSVAKILPKPTKSPGGTPFQTSIYFNCFDDHHIAVPYGGRLVLRLGWAALTEKQVDGFLHGSRTRAVVDGVPVPNADRYWGKSVSDGAGGWVTRWTYDTGRVITADSQPFTVEFEVVATRVVTDGFTTWNPGDVLVPIGGPCLVDGLAS
jgi:hypothetical protein